MLILSVGHIGFLYFIQMLLFFACARSDSFFFNNHPKNKGVADELFFGGKRVFGNSNVTEYIFCSAGSCLQETALFFYFIAVMRREVY